MIGDKMPAKDPEKKPVCFSLSPDDSRVCQSCAFRMKCTTTYKLWGNMESIEQARYRLERKGYVPQTDETFAELYARIYVRHYGRTPNMRNLSKPRARTILDKAQRICRENQLIPEIYITAQMHGMAKADLPFGFQPNMLLGEKALRRYEVYYGKTQRKYRTTTEGIMDSTTQAQKFVTDLTRDTVEVAIYYVASWVHKDEITWSAAIDFCDPEPVWCILDAQRRGATHLRGPYWELCRRFSDEFLCAVIDLTTITAACEVAARFDYTLPCRIGYRGVFSWECFARLLQRLCPPTAREAVSLAGISGELWEHGKK